MTKLIFGCGYLGERVAQRWRTAGHKVIVVTRSAHERTNVRATGLRRDRRRPNATGDASWIAGAPKPCCSPSATIGRRSQSIEDVYAGGMQNVLAALPSATGRFIYISTTGVYGDAGGDWIDEETPTDPQRDGGRASLAAEQALAAHPLGKNCVILRLAGIYGPGRIPFRQFAARRRANSGGERRVS